MLYDRKNAECKKGLRGISDLESKSSPLNPFINESASLKQTRRRRDSDPALFDNGQAQADLDADFIARYDRLMKPVPNPEDILESWEDESPATSYATAVLSGQHPTKIVAEPQAASQPAKLPASTNVKKNDPTIGHDMNVLKKPKKKKKGAKSSKKPTSRVQPAYIRKKRTELSFEDDVDQGFSVTGFRHWNVKKFNEHWEDFLPNYYK
jgi:hypothetical protein